MRILHLGKYFPPVPGGIERFLDELTTEQQRQGLRTAILAHDPDRSDIERGTRELRRVRSYGELGFVPLSPGWLGAFARLLREFDPDLLHLHPPNPWLFALLALPAARRLPWVVHWHADIPIDSPRLALRLGYPVYAWPERWLLRRASAVIATSQAYADSSGPLRAAGSRLHVVPLGLADAPACAPAPAWPAGGLRLLSVGRMSYYKGFGHLLEAMSRVEGCSLLMIGDGELRPDLQARTLELGLQERVRFAGRVDDATIEGAYRECDVLCLPSIDRAEAFGLVLLEAMRAGRPTLSSAVAGSGMSTVVEAERTGLQFPAGNVDAMVTQLIRLRDDPALSQRLGDAGRQRFESCFRIEPVVAAISRIYRAVVAG